MRGAVDRRQGVKGILGSMKDEIKEGGIEDVDGRIEIEIRMLKSER